MKKLILILCGLAALASAQTVAITSLTANSPNSLSTSFTVTGGSFASAKVSCGITNGSAYTVTTTPYIDVSTSPQTMIVAQMQPGTLYYCIVNVASATGGGGSVTGSAQSSATTLAPRLSYQLSMGVNTTYGGATLTEGDTEWYNNRQAANSRWTSGDTMVSVCALNGNCYMSGNDGRGPQDVLTATGSNIFFQAVDAGFTNISLANGLSSFGGSNANTCTDSAKTWKGGIPHAEGNRIYLPVYCQGTSGGWADFSMMASDDGGVTWWNPAHTSGTSNANGDAPTTGVAGSRLVVGASNFGMTDEWIECVGSGGWKGGICDNPVDGLDAYAYLISRDTTARYRYLLRVYKRSNFQAVASYQIYVGTVNGDVNNAANWSSTIASGTQVFDETGSACIGPRPYYLSDFGSYIIPCETTGTDGGHRYLFYQSQTALGWTNTSIAPLYAENKMPPFTSASWIGGSVGIHRQYIHPFPASYSLVSSNPPVATMKMLVGGDVSQFTYTDQPHNLYSVGWSPVTITTVTPNSPGVTRQQSQLRFCWDHQPNCYYAKGLENAKSQTWDMYTHAGNSVYPLNTSGLTFVDATHGRGCKLSQITGVSATTGLLLGTTATFCSTTANSGITGDPSYTFITIAKDTDVNTNLRAIWNTGVAVNGQVISMMVGNSAGAPIVTYRGSFVDSTNVIATGNYYCIAITHAAGALSTANTKLYKSGPTALTGSVTNSITPNVQDAVSNIGQTLDGVGTLGWRGEIDFIAFHYGVVLSGQEIKQNCSYLTKNLLAVRGLTVTP